MNRREMYVAPDRAIEAPNATVCVGVNAELIKDLFRTTVLQPPAEGTAAKDTAAKL